MTDVLATLQAVLLEAGFVARLTSIDRLSLVSLENEVLSGFGCVFDQPDDMLDHWKEVEMSFLRRYARDLLNAGEKAWNIYSIFLTGQAGDSKQERRIRWIEEDLERTRKIAACGITSRDDVVKALLPILPLQYHAALRREDITERLGHRISNITASAADIVLDESVRPSEVVRTLGTRQ